MSSPFCPAMAGRCAGLGTAPSWQACLSRSSPARPRPLERHDPAPRPGQVTQDCRRRKRQITEKEPAVACQQHGTTLRDFLPRAWDHRVASTGTTRWFRPKLRSAGTGGFGSGLVDGGAGAARRAGPGHAQRGRHGQPPASCGQDVRRRSRRTGTPPVAYLLRLGEELRPQTMTARAGHRVRRFVTGI